MFIEDKIFSKALNKKMEISLFIPSFLNADILPFFPSWDAVLSNSLSYGVPLTFVMNFLKLKSIFSSFIIFSPYGLHCKAGGAFLSLFIRGNLKVS